MGGGRKNNGKFYYFKDQKNCYRLGNDNLELVAVMECVSAAGDVMPPSFVFSDGPEPDLKVEDFGSLYTSPNGWSDNDHCKIFPMQRKGWSTRKKLSFSSWMVMALTKHSRWNRLPMMCSRKKTLKLSSFVSPRSVPIRCNHFTSSSLTLSRSDGSASLTTV